jgi:hypothetical protein
MLSVVDHSHVEQTSTGWYRLYTYFAPTDILVPTLRPRRRIAVLVSQIQYLSLAEMVEVRK